MVCGGALSAGRYNFWWANKLLAIAGGSLLGEPAGSAYQQILSLVILFVKDPDDIHPILGQETLVQDNLGVLFSPAQNPILFVAGSAIGALSLYGLWLRAKGLQNGGTKVSSTAGWSTAISLWLLGDCYRNNFRGAVPELYFVSHRCS